MTSTRGLFLCIEGGDGSGKGTQHELLAERLRSEGKALLTVDFPRYGQPSAELVGLYLNNEFGDATRLDPRLASLPFAIDRLAAKSEIEAALAAGKVVLANRFTASNMAHQGAKFATRKERVKFFKWLGELEHDIMGIPEPDYHFVLHVPAEIAQARVLKKADRTYTTKKLDGHEANLAYQERAEQTYLDLITTFPNRFGNIECVVDGYEKTPQEIHEEIWAKVKELAL